MGVDPIRWLHAHHLRQEGVDGAHPLLDPARQPLPFRVGDDARDDVERNKTFFRLGAAIDVEGDAGQPKQFFRFALLGPEVLGALVFEPGPESAIRCARRAIRRPHLVKEITFTYKAITGEKLTGCKASRRPGA